LIGMFFVFYAVNNIVILKQKSNPKLKKDTLRTNTLLYMFLILFLVLDLIDTKGNEPKTLLMIALSFFGLLNNYIGYKITRINFINTMKDKQHTKRNTRRILKKTISFLEKL